MWTIINQEGNLCRPICTVRFDYKKTKDGLGFFTIELDGAKYEVDEEFLFSKELDAWHFYSNKCLEQTTEAFYQAKFWSNETKLAAEKAAEITNDL